MTQKAPLIPPPKQLPKLVKDEPAKPATPKRVKIPAKQAAQWRRLQAQVEQAKQLWLVCAQTILDGGPNTGIPSDWTGALDPDKDELIFSPPQQ